MNLNTPLEFGGTIYDGNVYVSPKGTVTFGQGDYTFWDYPATPSISIAAFDYHAFANGVMWGAENNLYVRYGSTATSLCVDWKVMLWGQSSGDPIYIRMIAEVDPVNYTWTPTYQVSSNAPVGARYGVRYTFNGEVFSLEIQTITEPPAENPVIEPTPEPAPEPTPEPSPQPSPEPEPSPDPETSDPGPDPAPEIITPPSEENENPVIIEPEVPQELEQPTEEPTVEPAPEPTTQRPAPQPAIPPAEEPTPEPTTSQKPVEKPTENEPEPLPEPNQTETPKESERELEETTIPDFIANIPLIGDLAESIVKLFNELSNIGSDMDPEVREQAQKIVVVSIIVTQIVGVSAIAAMASTSRRK
jgi:hypothetical protein